LPASTGGPFFTLSYRGDSGGYTLEFRDTGPGISKCVYRNTTVRWSCSGVI